MKPFRAVSDAARDWAATIVFWPSFVGILLVFDILQRCAMRFAPARHADVIVLLNRSLVALLRAHGVRFRIRGEIPAPSGGPALIVSNHQSLFDVPIVHSLLGAFQPKWVAKLELARWIPSISYNLRYGGNLLIERSKALSAARALRHFGKRAASARHSIAIFPEGTRSRDGNLRSFQRGGIATLLSCYQEVKIIPVALDGAWELAKDNLFPIHPRRTISVLIGPCIEGAADAETAAEYASAAIQHNLQILRA